MKNKMQEDDLIPFYKILFKLGVHGSYKGFYQVAYGASLMYYSPTKYTMVTKQVYPDVAKYFGCSPASVERNVRTVASKVQAAHGKKLSNRELLMLIVKEHV